MAAPIIKTSFAAGELTPSLQGRVDLAKYQVGAAVMRNFFVDPRGGATTRPGTRHVAQSRPGIGTPVPRLVPFVFNSQQAYVLELHAGRMRVIFDGAVVTRAPFAIAAAGNAASGVQLRLVVAGHDFVAGDMVRLDSVAGLARPSGISAVNGRTFLVSHVDGTEVYLSEQDSDAGYRRVDPSGWTPFVSGIVSKVFEILTPWASDDLFSLNFVQSADVMTVTHLDYPAYDIKRYAAADWRIEPEVYGAQVPPPTDVLATPLATGDAATQLFFYPYVVTALDANGRESAVGAGASCVNKALDPSLALPGGGTVSRVNQITWTAVPGATQYRVYKAQPIPDGLQGTGPYTYGVVGNVFTIQFTDVNYAPDFTQGPPVPRDPFNGGAANRPNCCAYLQQRRVFGGSRENPSTLWLSRPGQFTNFNVSEPTQDDDAITAALNATEVNTITSLITAPGGLLALTSGGAYLITGEGGVTPSTLNAQPQAFVGAQDGLQPLRVGNQLLYAQSRGSIVAELAYNFYSSTFASQDISVLSAHLLENHRIVQWVYAGEPFHMVWAVRDDGVLLSLTYLKEQEVYGWARHDTHGSVVSIATIPEGREDAVYLVVKRLTGIGYTYHVERMVQRVGAGDPVAAIPATAEAAWCVDGGAAYEPQPRNGWLDVVSVDRGLLIEPAVGHGGVGYVNPVVEINDPTGTGGDVRASIFNGVINGAVLINGGRGYSDPRLIVRDASGSGAALTVALATYMTFTSPTPPEAIGAVVRVRGGKGRVEAIEGQSFRCRMERMPTAMANGETPDQMLRAEPGTWTVSYDVTRVGGLDHLNGSTVQVLADGQVHAPRQVVNGEVALDIPASHVIVGQGFTAQLQTMPVEIPQGSTLQGRRKSVSKVVVRLRESRGLVVGQSWNDLFELPQREHEPWGAPTRLQRGGQALQAAYEGAPLALEPLVTDDLEVPIQTDWTETGVICIQQSWPLPATVLAVIPFLTPGDTTQ